MQNKNQGTAWEGNNIQNNNSNTNVLELFPTPLVATKMPDNLSNIIPFLDAQAPNTGSDVANYGERSANSYILNEPECIEAKTFILQQVKEFADNILLFDYDEYELSQSWVSRKHPGQHHTMHTHPNSLISGVFYYGEPAPNTPAIKFHKMSGGMNVNQLQAKTKPDKRPSKFAWDTFSVQFEPGLLVLFPSYLFHSVPMNESDKIRSSVAFNVVPKNNLGQEENLTELNFNKII